MADKRARHRRPGSDDPAGTALRRLGPAAPAEPAPDGALGGWVPQPPSAPTAPGRGPRARAEVADRLPVELRAAVVSPGGRAVSGLVLLVSLAVVAALVAAWLARPREHPVPERSRPVGAPVALAAAGGAPSASPPPDTATSAAARATTVWVHVAGAVRRPGLVELRAGSRVADAVQAVGGPTRRADEASVNLARPVVDGEQVVVLRRGEHPRTGPAGPSVPSGAAGSAASGSTTSAPVDLNTATLEQLDLLPGIGPVLAQRILDWRAAHGRFSSVEELGEISGIGEATLADLRPGVTV